MARRLRVSASFVPTFDRTSSAYDVLGGIRDQVRSWTDWPDVSAYDVWASGLARAAGRTLLFRDVGRAEVVARGGYDSFIAETGLIPTRSRSWHDFFNACIWSRLPRAKLAVHAAQLEESSARRGVGHPGTGRTRRQDWLTHFDECGVVVVSDRQELLERIATLAWHELFVDGRAAFVQHAAVVCFGHATLEALREPYSGLMGKALLCRVPEGMVAPSTEEARGASTSGWRRCSPRARYRVCTRCRCSVCPAGMRPTSALRSTTTRSTFARAPACSARGTGPTSAALSPTPAAPRSSPRARWRRPGSSPRARAPPAARARRTRTRRD